MEKWIENKFHRPTLDYIAWLCRICLTKLIWEQMGHCCSHRKVDNSIAFDPAQEINVNTVPSINRALQ